MRRITIAVLALAVGLVGTACRSTGCARAAAPLPCPTMIEVGSGLETQVFLDLQVLEVPESRLAALLGEPPPLAAGPRVLVPGQAEALAARIAADASLHVVAGPSMIAVVDQEASMVVGENMGEPEWRGLAARWSPRLAPRPNEVELDLHVTHRPGAPSTEQQVDVRRQRVESGLTVVLLGELRRDGGPRFVVTFKPTLIRPPTQ